MKITDKRIKWADWISASLVLISLLFVKTISIFWLVYAGACITYTFINFHKKLYGQGTMNFIAALIAIKNFFI